MGILDTASGRSLHVSTRLTSSGSSFAVVPVAAEARIQTEPVELLVLQHVHVSVVQAPLELLPDFGLDFFRRAVLGGLTVHAGSSHSEMSTEMMPLTFRRRSRTGHVRCQNCAWEIDVSAHGEST